MWIHAQESLVHYRINLIKPEVMDYLIIVIENAMKLTQELQQCRELLQKTNEEAAALRNQCEGKAN